MQRRRTRIAPLLVLAALGCSEESQDPQDGANRCGKKCDGVDNAVVPGASVVDVQVQILSTHLAGWAATDYLGNDPPAVERPGPTGEPVTWEGDTVGHEGFSALVTVVYSGGTEEKILVDAGERAEIVWNNAKILGVDLHQVKKVLITHWHWDHQWGLEGLRNALVEEDPNSPGLSQLYVSKYAWYPRHVAAELGDNGEVIALKKDPQGNPVQRNDWPETVEAYRQTFAIPSQFSIVQVGDEPEEISKDVWSTGFVPRRVFQLGSQGNLSERSYPAKIRLARAAQLPKHGGGKLSIAVDDADLVPDDQALVVNSQKGLVIVSGCSHAGVANIVAHARDFVPRLAQQTSAPPVALVAGGLHLWDSSSAYVKKVGSVLSGLGVDQLIGAHCSGVNPLPILRDAMGKSQHEVVIGTVGWSFRLQSGGIHLGQIEQAMPADE